MEGTIYIYRQNTDELLASNASYSLTLLKLVEYYHRKNPKDEIQAHLYCS